MIEVAFPFAIIFIAVAYAYWQGIQDGYAQGREDGWNHAHDQERKDRE